MKKTTLFLILCLSVIELSAQYATLGTGSLKDKIWWFNWNGFTLSNGASRVFTTIDGIQVTVTVSNVGGTAPVPAPRVMNTWSGAVLHLLYNFTDPAIMPALFSTTPVIGQSSEFTMNVTATRNGITVPFTFIAADAEGSSEFELTTLTTSGGNWKAIDFFKNSSQTGSPLTGCNTNKVVIANTYGGVASTGQNPVLATEAPASGSLQINTAFNRQGVFGGMAIAFGILAPIDRGDLPAGYGFAQHKLTYTATNSCNYQPPYPSLVQDTRLKIGTVAGDADGAQTTDDNAIGVDEDGIAAFPMYDKSGIYSLTIPVSNTTATSTWLAGWFDYNRDGNFSNSERVVVPVAVNATIVQLSWSGLPSLLAGTGNFGFRFRLSSDKTAAESATGFAPDGEVEDYTASSGEILPVKADFILPDTVCVNTPVTITNASAGASSYFWNFCAAGANNSLPTGTNLGSMGNTLQLPVFTDIVADNGNFYVFVVNHVPAGLVRLDFGNSLLNTPSVHSFGNLGVIPPSPEGIQVVKDASKWYAIIVGGDPKTGAISSIVKIDFGNSITNNSPTAVNWGNIGSLNFPIDLHIFQEGNNWYGFTLNANTQTITRFNFGNSFDNIPSAVNLGNLGGLNVPTGICAVQDNGRWHVFITNEGGSSSITRLDFGSSLLSTPTAVNLGNPGNVLAKPRDIFILNSCGKITGMIVNGTSHEVTRLDFGTNITAVPSGVSLGNLGNLSFPHSVSRLFRVGADLYTFITNVNNNTITRIKFNGCSNASVANSTLAIPPVITYNTPGTYNVNLSVDEGLSTQSSVCKNVVVMPTPVPDFSFEQQVCNPLSVRFKSETEGSFKLHWDFGDGAGVADNTGNPVYVYKSYKSYPVKLVAGEGKCAAGVAKNLTVDLSRDSFITTHDTVSCNGKAVTLQALPAVAYCWSPAASLSAADLATPAAQPATPTTYYVHAKVLGKNLVVNGDFSQGNSGFGSQYSYVSINTTEGEYFVGKDPSAWNPSTRKCSDHTDGRGNMLLVNGSPVDDVKVWCQDIPITPHTNYAFSAWLQAIHPQNPSRLQFYINGKVVANIFEADPTPCAWKQFYMTWNSGNESSVNICIVNKNTIVAGNDFALDDIFFGSVTMRYDSVKLGLVTSPVLPAINDKSICEGDTLKPVASGALFYNWTPVQYVSGSSTAAPLIYPPQSVVYTLSGYNRPGCTSQQSFNVKVSPAPHFSISPASTRICEGDEVAITATGADHYTWMVNNAVDASLNGNAIKTTPGADVRYAVAVRDDLCGRVDTLESFVKVNVIPVPVVSKTNDVDCMTGGANLRASGGTSYRWSPATGLSDAGISNPVVTALQTTKYYVAVSKEGCSATDSIVVRVNLNSEKNLYLVPTAFTPNGDGKNDCFGLKHWGRLTSLQFAIYNRWGQQVFLSNETTNCWNGTFKGEPQPGGAYVYVISGTALCGPVLRKGTVLLIR